MNDNEVVQLNRELGQVFTKKWVSDYMVSLLSVGKEAMILDPCFGEGVFLSSLKENGFQKVTGYELDEVLYNKVCAEYSDYALRKCNFLSINDYGVFDAVIMNPPYIRHEKIDELVNYGITKDILFKNSDYTGLSRRSNLYMFFIIRSLLLLHEGGELVAIFPSNWLSANFGKMFEKKIEKLGTIVVKTNVKGDAFESSPDVDVIIMKIIRGVYDVEGKFFSICNHIIESEKAIPEIQYYYDGIALKDVANIFRGITTGSNSFFINPPVNENNTIPIIISPKNIIGYSTDHARIDRLLYVSDRTDNQLMEYLVTVQKKIDESNKYKSLKKKIENGKEWQEIGQLKTGCILFGYIIRDKPRFIINKDKILARDNFYAINTDVNHYFLLSLLNNYYTYVQIEERIKKYGSGLLKVQKYDLDSVVVPEVSKISSEDVNLLISLAKELVKTGNDLIIDEISKVISKYSKISFDCIIDRYYDCRKSRLMA